MVSKVRTIEGFRREQIVRMLGRNEKMRFTDMGRKLGISKPVLSEHLHLLKKQHVIDSFWKGRERYYFLSNKIRKVPQRQIDIFSYNYLIASDLKLLFHDYDDCYEIFDEIAKKLTVFLIFSVLRSLQTGQNWLNAVDIKEFSRTVVDILANFIAESKESRTEVLDELSELNMSDFKPLHSILNKPIHKSNIRRMYEELWNAYPEEMELIKSSLRFKRRKLPNASTVVK